MLIRFPANVAVGSRRLGLKTAIVTELGDDINGFVVKHELERAKVDTKTVKMLKAKETRYSVVLNYKGERTILSYHIKRKYNLPKLPDSKWLYYSSMGDTFENLQKQLVKYLVRHPNTKLAVNPGSYQMKNGLKIIKSILPYVSILFVNKEEAEKLVGKKDIKATVKSLHRAGVKIAVVTNGTKGSFASNGQSIYSMPAYPIKSIARTGAGDAYAGGFLSAIISGHTVSEAMQWGTANAAGVIQKIGAQKGLLTKSSIKGLVSKYKKIKPKVV